MEQITTKTTFKNWMDIINDTITTVSDNSSSITNLNEDVNSVTVKVNTLPNIKNSLEEVEASEDGLYWIIEEGTGENTKYLPISGGSVTGAITGPYVNYTDSTLPDSIDISIGNIFEIKYSTDITISFSNLDSLYNSNTNTSYCFSILFSPTNGTEVISWDNSIEWDHNTPPNIDTNKVFTFFVFPNGNVSRIIGVESWTYE